MITRRRSDRARHACFASAMPRSRACAALVELVENDGSKTHEQRILLQACRRDALGGEQHPAGPNRRSNRTPPNFVADRPAPFDGDARRQASRRNASRLEHDHRPVDRQRRWNTRRLASARCGRNDNRSGVTNFARGCRVLPNRWGGRGHSWFTVQGSGRVQERCRGI